MKATKLFLTIVAAAAMMFASCDKDNNNDNNNDNNTPSEATENTLVLNGKVYRMTSTYKYEQGEDGRVYIDAYAVDQQNGQPIFHIISDNPGNGTYDLTQRAVFFGVTSNVDYITGFYSESTYTSGTIIIEKDDNAFRMRMSGTMEDGTTVAFHIYVPALEWEEVVYDR